MEQWVTTYASTLALAGPWDGLMHASTALGNFSTLTFSSQQIKKHMSQAECLSCMVRSDRLVTIYNLQI